MPLPSPTAPSVAASLAERAASRLLSLCLRHAALLRPLPPPARLALAKDLAELQAAVGQQLYPVERLGAPYRALRAFRTLLFAEPAALSAGGVPALADLPPSLVLHHLFSRLPAAVASPAQRAGQAPAAYAAALETVGAEEAVGRVRAALGAEGVEEAVAAAGGCDGLLEFMKKLSSSM